jgi:transcriptional antiterminator
LRKRARADCALAVRKIELLLSEFRTRGISMNDVQMMLDQVKAGERLREAERLELLEALDDGTRTASDLAKLLGVSERQIRRDRAKLRERYAKALQDLAIAGELYRQFQITLARMDQAIAQENYQRVRALALRWGVCEGFGKLAIQHQINEIEKVIAELKRLRSQTGVTYAIN